MIMVVGGTGMLGSSVVEELLRRGEEVAVLGRDAGRITQRFGQLVDARQADVRNREALDAAFAGIDVVVNAVQFPGFPVEQPRKGWTFEETDYQGTRNQVDAAKAAGVRRFVYLSGVGASPTANKHWFRFKWMAEQYLEQSGLEWVVIRPTWVYGPTDYSLNRLLGFGKLLPFIPMFGDGRQAMQPVFVDDVGRVVADAATTAAAANQVFELGGPQVMTMNEVLQAGLSVQGKKRPILHLPIFVGKLIGHLASLLPAPRLSADAIDFVAGPAVADNRNLEQALRPKLTPLLEGLGTYLKSK